ncbi:MAG: 50S ribosomal protein L9, partial [Lachnospiraceae bacterium]|nr:50S ribosomal protein L9 [Lachnospiraceae bacterium]
AKERLEEAKAFAEELKERSVTVRMKTGSGGRSFGSVSTKEIAAAAKEQLGYELDKKKMVLNDPIKSLGTYMIQIKLHPKVTGELKVVVQEA